MKNQKRLAATAFMFVLNQALAQNVVMQQPITPDMCVDAVCVEQDLGAIPAGLAWTAPARPEEPNRDFKKSYDEGIRKGLDTCEQSNKAQWGSKASKLCDLLIFGNQRSRAQLVSFFAENKQPVCVTGGKFFNFGLTTQLGATKFQVKFGRDGRPRIAEITKFFAVSKDEQAALKDQIEKKHPYLHLRDGSSATPPWGGYVRFIDITGSYELRGREALFTRSNAEPDQGACATAPRQISVQ